MEVIIQPTAGDAALLATRIIADTVDRKPHAVLGLATGRTMVPVYQGLVRFHRERGLDLSLVRTFNLDEYVGIPSTHPQSYRSFMNRVFFEQANVDIRNTRVLDGMAADLDAECQAFEGEIADCGGIDLQVLGIGRSGHIGFNEPASSLRSRTRSKTLTPKTLEQNGPLFGGSANMPRHVLTMGVGTILDSERCLMLITGEEKAEMAAKAIEGPLTAMVTASAMQIHPHCVVVLDEAAAAELSLAEYYRWVYENEPYWQRLGWR